MFLIKQSKRRRLSNNNRSEIQIIIKWEKNQSKESEPDLDADLAAQAVHRVTYSIKEKKEKIIIKSLDEQHST